VTTAQNQPNQGAAQCLAGGAAKLFVVMARCTCSHGDTASKHGRCSSTAEGPPSDLQFPSGNAVTSAVLAVLLHFTRDTPRYLPIITEDRK